MKKRIIRYSLIPIGIVILDMVTKHLISQNISLYDHVEIIKDFFWLTNYHNTGAAWSIFEGQMLFFYGMTFIALCYVGYTFYKSEDNELLLRIGLSTILGGILGNFIDRLILHYVRDFLSFNIFGYDFPVFNVADIAISVGFGFVVLQIVLEEYKKWKLSKSL